MIYSCCASLSLLETVERAGYDRIILPGTEVAAWSDQELAAAVEKLRQSRLTCRALNSFCTPELILCGPNYDPEKVKAYIDGLAPRAAALGAVYIGVGSPKSRSIPDGFDKDLAMDQWCETLNILCDACAPHGITILLEAVCAMEGNWMTTTASALEVVRRVGRKELQIVFDTYHAFMMDEDAAPLKEAMPHVRLVHVAQDIGGRRHYLRWEDFDEYKVYFDALLAAGFDGEVAVEAFYDDPAEQLPVTLNIMKALCGEGGKEEL